MNTPKFYTPSIEEFHVGFEYEYFENKSWYQNILTKDDIVIPPDCDDNLHQPFYWKSDDNFKEKFRVKYLDQEDIESFRFEHIGSLWFKSKNSDYAIRKWKDNEIDIYTDYSYRDIPGHGSQIIFRGQIKNKSELKKVLQMVGVIKEGVN